ncbi:MAG: hypothetical protein ABIL58_09230 [Pseudomonadota bacterium]
MIKAGSKKGYFFLAAGFLAAGFLAAGFFAAGFFAAGFFAVAMKSSRNLKKLETALSHSTQKKMIA